MPQSSHHPAPACPHCADFRVVAITTGRRMPDGTRETTNATCPAPRHTGPNTRTRVRTGVA